MNRLTCENWLLFQLTEIPAGFVAPAYQIIAPDRTKRNVSADRLRDALDRLFEESA